MAECEQRWLSQYPPEIPPTLDYPVTTLTKLLIDAAEEFPEQTAIIFLGKKITYKALIQDVYRLANGLQELGVQKGDRVAIMLPNSPQAVISYYAILLIGAIVVQVNPTYKRRELKKQLADSEVTMIICLDLVYSQVMEVIDDTKLEQIIVTSIKDYLPFPKNWLYGLSQKKAGIPRINYDERNHAFLDIVKKALAKPIETSIDPQEDIAIIQYTGGTTGLAKGAMLTHYNLIVNVYQVSSWFYRTKRGQIRILGVLPFFHVYGMTTVMNFAIKEAGTMILVPKFDRTQVLRCIQKYRPTLFPGAPTIYISLMNHPKITRYDLSSIDACISGSAPLPLDVQEKFEQLTGGRLIEGYGLTETSPVTHANLVWDRVKNNTVGLPWPDTLCRIVHMETGEELAPGEIGEIQVKGPQVMKGYWKRPEETAEVLQDGWLNTGDIGKMDEDGYFYILDRKKEMIIAGGFNIYPREIEEVLYEHPGILEAAVIGVPDKYRGETVKAYIVLKPEHVLTSSEIDRYCREHLSSYKVPRLYEFRDELPKSMIGKVLKRVLIEELEQHDDQPADS